MRAQTAIRVRVVRGRKWLTFQVSAERRQRDEWRATIGDVLQRAGVFGGRCVPVRLWWRLPQILEDYREFASWRVALFRGAGWTPGDLLPASTCVGGEVLSCRGVIVDRQSVRLLKAISGQPWLPDPQQYGYFFARGLLVDSERYRRLYLSATGALDSDGNPEPGETERLMRQSFNRLGSIIQREGFGPDVTVRWVVWRPSAYANQRPLSPPAAMRVEYRTAELCRTGLSFEVEAFAKEAT